VQKIEAPADRLDSTAPISPWMWNSGMMLRQRSPGASCRKRPMLPAEAVTLRFDSGTIFGREVVPDVCRISATSSGADQRGVAVAGSAPARSASVKPPAGPSAGVSSITSMPCRSAPRRSVTKAVGGA